MTLRFTTSVATDRGSFLEGREIDVPDPLPELILEWLRRGVLVPVASVLETAMLSPATVQQAVARRGKRSPRPAAAEGD